MEDELLCSHCKKEIDTDNEYMRFAGDNLHPDCLIGYMRKLKVLVIINSHKSNGKNDE